MYTHSQKKKNEEKKEIENEEELCEDLKIINQAIQMKQCRVKKMI